MKTNLTKEFYEDYWKYFSENIEFFNLKQNESIRFDILAKRLNYLFYYFLNYPSSIKQILWTFINRIPTSDFLKKQISDYYELICITFNQPISKSFKEENKLEFCYKILERQLELISFPTKEVEIKLNKRTTTGPAKKYIDKIKRFSREKLDGDFLLLCSLATDDYKWEWSDFDSIYILSENNIEAKMIKTLQKHFLYLKSLYSLIDIHQDHGIFIVLPFQKNYYSQSLMPIQVLEKGSALNFSNPTINLRVRKNDWQDKIFFYKKFLMEVEELQNHKEPIPYQLKRLLLHRIYLLPALILQNAGTYTYKKESFDLIKTILPKVQIQFIEECSQIYLNWKHIRHYRNKVIEFLLYKNPNLVLYILKLWYKNERIAVIENFDLNWIIIDYKKFLKDSI